MCFQKFDNAAPWVENSWVYAAPMGICCSMGWKTDVELGGKKCFTAFNPLICGGGETCQETSSQETKELSIFS